MAVSGTQCSGTTALVDELSRALPTYEVVDEPYFLLEEEGRQFAEVPTLADFELQAHRSAKSIVRSGRDSLFERCPVDFLAYLLAHRESKHFHVAAWLPRLRDAVERLDLIVFVPVEHPGRILVPSAELPGLRRRVDAQLQKFLF